MLKFDWKDFRPVGEGLYGPETVTEIAQKLHDEWLEKQKEVWGHDDIIFSNRQYPQDTHKAFLVNIERIEK